MELRKQALVQPRVDEHNGLGCGQLPRSQQQVLLLRQAQSSQPIPAPASAPTAAAAAAITTAAARVLHSHVPSSRYLLQAGQSCCKARQPGCPKGRLLVCLS